MLENSLSFLITPRSCNWGLQWLCKSEGEGIKKSNIGTSKVRLWMVLVVWVRDRRVREKGKLNERKWVSSFKLLFCVLCFCSKKSEIAPDNIPSDVQKWRQDDGSELIEKLSPFVSFAPLLTIEATNGILNEASTCLRTSWRAWTERQIFAILLWAEIPPWF